MDMVVDLQKVADLRQLIDGWKLRLMWAADPGLEAARMMVGRNLHRRRCWTHDGKDDTVGSGCGLVMASW